MNRKASLKYTLIGVGITVLFFVILFIAYYFLSGYLYEQEVMQQFYEKKKTVELQWNELVNYYSQFNQTDNVTIMRNYLTLFNITYYEEVETLNELNMIIDTDSNILIKHGIDVSEERVTINKLIETLNTLNHYMNLKETLYSYVYETEEYTLVLNRLLDEQLEYEKSGDTASAKEIMKKRIDHLYEGINMGLKLKEFVTSNSDEIEGTLKIEPDEILSSIEYDMSLLKDEIKTIQDELSLIENEEYRQSQDVGDFKVIYVASDNPFYSDLKELFEQTEFFDLMVNMLNEKLILPQDITILLTECGVSNAYYSDGTLVMCYELIEQIYDQYYPYFDTEDEFVEAFLGTTYFVFFHELGHALIDVYDLPITGKEEDVADQISTVFLTAGEDESTALNGAYYFLLNSENSLYLDYADEHSLDIQRFYNIACWVYGKDTYENSWLVDYEYLPYDRAVRCESEYEQMYISIITLLSPYVK